MLHVGPEPLYWRQLLLQNAYCLGWHVTSCNGFCEGVMCCDRQDHSFVQNWVRGFAVVVSQMQDKAPSKYGLRELVDNPHRACQQRGDCADTNSFAHALVTLAVAIRIFTEKRLDDLRVGDVLTCPAECADWCELVLAMPWLITCALVKLKSGNLAIACCSGADWCHGSSSWSIPHVPLQPERQTTF